MSLADLRRYGDFGVGTFDKLSGEINRILAMKDIIERLAAAGFQTEGGSPEEFTRYMKAEISKWSKVIKAANIPVD